VIRNVTFEDVKFDRSDNGCRIKSHANGTGLVADITYRNISVSNVLWPIIVDGFYGAGKEGKTAVHFRNLSFAGIRGQAFSGAKFHCDPDYPCQGISMQVLCIRSGVVFASSSTVLRYSPLHGCVIAGCGPTAG
jgi:hypothetical protein